MLKSNRLLVVAVVTALSIVGLLGPSMTGLAAKKANKAGDADKTLEAPESALCGKNANVIDPKEPDRNLKTHRRLLRKPVPEPAKALVTASQDAFTSAYKKFLEERGATCKAHQDATKKLSDQQKLGEKAAAPLKASFPNRSAYVGDVDCGFFSETSQIMRKAGALSQEYKDQVNWLWSRMTDNYLKRAFNSCKKAVDALGKDEKTQGDSKDLLEECRQTYLSISQKEAKRPYSGRLTAGSSRAAARENGLFYPIGKSLTEESKAFAAFTGNLNTLATNLDGYRELCISGSR